MKKVGANMLNSLVVTNTNNSLYSLINQKTINL